MALNPTYTHTDFVFRLAKVSIGGSDGADTAAVDRLALGDDGEAIRWFSLPFETSSPRLPSTLGWANPSPTILTPKVYPCQRRTPDKDSE